MHHSVINETTKEEEEEEEMMKNRRKKLSRKQFANKVNRWFISEFFSVCGDIYYAISCLKEVLQRP